MSAFDTRGCHTPSTFDTITFCMHVKAFFFYGKSKIKRK